MVIYDNTVVSPRVVILDLSRFDAFVFDLDGVLTMTAAVHAAAWKRLFDEVLVHAAAGQPWVPFDVDADYRTHVDGKPRRDGLRSFLASRGIVLAEGDPGDGPAENTIHGLAARKNTYVQDQLDRHGVEAYPDAVVLLRRARSSNVRLAVVSASENCAAVLAAAHLTEYFAVRVDGIDIRQRGLRGKPAPDTFIEAARRLETDPRRIVLFEDAIAGVEAGRAGNFGMVVGVDHFGGGEALHRHGADIVVQTLDEITLTHASGNGCWP